MAVLHQCKRIVSVIGLSVLWTCLRLWLPSPNTFGLRLSHQRFAISAYLGLMCQTHAVPSAHLIFSRLETWISSPPARRCSLTSPLRTLVCRYVVRTRLSTRLWLLVSCMLPVFAFVATYRLVVPASTLASQGRAHFGIYGTVTLCLLPPL